MTPEEACNFPLDLENHYGYVYLLTFPNGKQYIGQSTNPWRHRWTQHKSPRSLCVALRNAIAKYGIDDLQWELVCYATSAEELNELESSYIANRNTLAPAGYNLKDGGEGHIYSEISKHKMSLSNTLAHIRKENNTEQDTETLLALAKERVIYKACKRTADKGFNVISFITAQNENVCLTAAQYSSRIHMQAFYRDPVKSSELREKLHEKQKSLRSRPIYCEETKETFSCTREAIEKHPEWNKDKINWCCAKHNKTHLGLHFRFADLTEKEIADVKAYWEREEHVINSGSYAPRAVYCIETGKVYISSGQAARELGIERSHITSVCSGKRKSVSGLHFTYAPSEPFTSAPSSSPSGTQEPL